MKIDVRKICVSELNDYWYSSNYQNNHVWPVSRGQMESLVSNPRSQSDDVVMVVAEKDNLFIAYVSVLIDRIEIKAEERKVAWVSSYWIDPEFKRSDVLEVLLSALCEEWDGSLLIFTSGRNKVIKDLKALKKQKDLEGVRFNMKSNLAESLAGQSVFAKAIKKVLPTADNFFNHFILPFLTEPGMKSRLSYNMMIKKRLNVEESALLFSKSPSNRSLRELNWIMSLPWTIRRGDLSVDEEVKYLHSITADELKQYFCVIYKNGVLIAIVMISIKDAQMAVPYYYSQDLDLSVIADLLFTEAWKNSTSYIDVYNSELVAEMKLKTAYYAFSKIREKHFFASPELKLENELVEQLTNTDGEGDSVLL